MIKILTIVSIFLVFVMFNIYIRVKTMAYYRELVKRRIQFQFGQLFSASRWQTEVLDKYPKDQELLTVFRAHILRTGILFVTVIVLVMAMLFVLKIQLHS